MSDIRMQQIGFSVSDPSIVAEARRTVLSLSKLCGLDDTASGKAALIVTEAATNLVKHATGGELLLRPIDEEGNQGIEILALDRGPGISNIGESLRDGFSTVGSPGTGLGAITRLSTDFDIHSIRGKGTALVSRLFGSGPAHTAYQVGAVCQPKRGETSCGDGWEFEKRQGGISILVSDGLGHGPDAAKATNEAINSFRNHSSMPPADVLSFTHGALRSTRGAAVAAARLNLAGELTYAGIGNIAGVIIGRDNDRHLVSQSGIVGHEIRKIQEFSYPWSHDALLVLHTDGLATHWNLKSYPGITSKDPSLIAAVLYRDYSRERDDVTVVVIKEA